MDITVRIPDDLAKRLGSPGELERRALEALALEEYKLGHLTRPELRRLLGFGTRTALDEFVTSHGLFGTYTEEDLERDRQPAGAQLLKVNAACRRRYRAAPLPHTDRRSTLFDRVLIPQTVRDELAHRNAPALVGGNGSLKLRLWLEVRPNPDRDSGDRMMVALDDGEQAAIALAVAVGADLV
jgi:hypothetical protein